MADALTQELRRLDIPFFAIRADLIFSDTGQGGGTISKDELVVLQRRMLELLGDLCEMEG